MTDSIVAVGKRMNSVSRGSIRDYGATHKHGLASRQSSTRNLIRDKYRFRRGRRCQPGLCALQAAEPQFLVPLIQNSHLVDRFDHVSIQRASACPGGTKPAAREGQTQHDSEPDGNQDGTTTALHARNNCKQSMMANPR
jgi:hypothetical protein